MDIMTKVMFIAGIVMAVAWVILYVVNMSRYDRELSAVPREDYMMVSPLIFGFGFMRLIRFDIKKLKYR